MVSRDGNNLNVFCLVNHHFRKKKNKSAKYTRLEANFFIELKCE